MTGVLASSVRGVFTEFLLRAGPAGAGAGRVTSSPSWGSEPRGRPVRGARTHTGARGSAAPRRASVPPAADWSSQSLRGVSRRPVRSARHARNGPRHDAPGPRSHARSGAGTLVAGTPQEASTLPAPGGAEAPAAHGVLASGLALCEETGGFVGGRGFLLVLRASLGHLAGGAAMGPGLRGAVLGPGAGFELALGLTPHPSRQALAPPQACARPRASGDRGSRPALPFTGCKTSIEPCCLSGPQFLPL